VKKVLVIGSSNTDMVVRVRNIPHPGQTVMGEDLQTFAGGKGANQAVAARRAGADVLFMAAVGNDDFGKAAIEVFKREGIGAEHIEVLDEVPSGVAMIFVSDEGENCIGVAPGANSRLAARFLNENERVFERCSHLLIQLEIPMETVETAIRLASKTGTRVILNPAPATRLSDRALADLYCITPNEHELEELTGISVSDRKSARKAAQALLQSGVENVIITMGSEGALLVNSVEEYHQGAEIVNVVDTTGAGDTFNGVLTAMLAEGRSLKDSIDLAVRGATLSVQRPGATDSVPYRHEFLIQPSDGVQIEPE
jgi:ribokinase